MGPNVLYIFPELYFVCYMQLQTVFFLLCQARKNVNDFLATVDDPQTTLLDLLESCNISKGKGNSLANLIANETQKWLLEHPECQLVRTKLRTVKKREKKQFYRFKKGVHSANEMNYNVPNRIQWM